MKEFTFGGNPRVLVKVKAESEQEAKLELQNKTAHITLKEGDNFFNVFVSYTIKIDETANWKLVN